MIVLQVYYDGAAENKVTPVRAGFRNEAPNAFLLPRDFSNS